MLLGYNVSVSAWLTGQATFVASIEKPGIYFVCLYMCIVYLWTFEFPFVYSVSLMWELKPGSQAFEAYTLPGR